MHLFVVSDAAPKTQEHLFDVWVNDETILKSVPRSHIRQSYISSKGLLNKNRTALNDSRMTDMNDARIDDDSKTLSVYEATDTKEVDWLCVGKHVLVLNAVELLAIQYKKCIEYSTPSGHQDTDDDTHSRCGIIVGIRKEFRRSTTSMVLDEQRVTVYDVVLGESVLLLSVSQRLLQPLDYPSNPSGKKLEALLAAKIYEVQTLERRKYLASKIKLQAQRLKLKNRLDSLDTREVGGTKHDTEGSPSKQVQRKLSNMTHDIRMKILYQECKQLRHTIMVMKIQAAQLKGQLRDSATKRRQLIRDISNPNYVATNALKLHEDFEKEIGEQIREVGDAIFVKRWTEGFVIQRQIHDRSPRVAKSLEIIAPNQISKQKKEKVFYNVQLLDGTILRNQKSSELKSRTNLIDSQSLDEFLGLINCIKQLDGDYLKRVPTGSLNKVIPTGIDSFVSYLGVNDDLAADTLNDDHLTRMYSIQQYQRSLLEAKMTLLDQPTPENSDTYENSASKGVEVAFLAASVDDTDILQKVIEKYSIDCEKCINKDGCNLLMIAAAFNSLHVVDMLTNMQTASEMVNFTEDQNQASVMEIAAAFGGHDVITRLLQAKADLQHPKNARVLEVAVQYNNLHAVKEYSKLFMEFQCCEYSNEASSNTNDRSIDQSIGVCILCEL